MSYHVANPFLAFSVLNLKPLKAKTTKQNQLSKFNGRSKPVLTAQNQSTVLTWQIENWLANTLKMGFSFYWLSLYVYSNVAGGNRLLCIRTLECVPSVCSSNKEHQWLRWQCTGLIVVENWKPVTKTAPAHTHTCTRIHVHAHTHTHTDIYTCMHTNINTHAHTSPYSHSVSQSVCMYKHSERVHDYVRVLMQTYVEWHTCVYACQCRILNYMLLTQFNSSFFKCIYFRPLFGCFPHSYHLQKRARAARSSRASSYEVHQAETHFWPSLTQAAAQCFMSPTACMWRDDNANMFVYPHAVCTYLLKCLVSHWLMHFIHCISKWVITCMCALLLYIHNCTLLVY